MSSPNSSPNARTLRLRLRRRSPAAQARYLAKVLEEVAESLGRRPERGTVAGVGLALVRLAEELELELGP